jgi:L-lactate dehydrogenase complex protein LldG
MPQSPNGHMGNGEGRVAIMSAIRAHLAESAGGPVEPPPSIAPRAAGREAPRIAPQDTPEPIAQAFRRAVEAVSGRCTLVAGVADAADVVRAIVRERNATRVAVSDSPLAREVVGLAAPDTAVTDVSPVSLFASDVGVTGVQWGIAETGTLVLVSDAEHHRLASLVPPVHIALLRAVDLRRTLGDVLAEIGGRGVADISRCVTFITGPSRTSDIELTLALGVHGPVELHVIVLGE